MPFVNPWGAPRITLPPSWGSPPVSVPSGGWGSPGVTSPVGGRSSGAPPPLTYTSPPPSPPPPPPPFNFRTDPGYAAAVAAQQTGSASLDARLRQARVAALIGFGDEGFAVSSGFGLTPEELEAVRAMGKSGKGTLALLKRRRAMRRAALINRLAGRGILFSGELGYGERENEADFGDALSQAQAAVLGSLRAAQETTLDKQQELRDAVIRSLSQAYRNYLTNPHLYSGAF